jgi:carbonic anhydrase
MNHFERMLANNRQWAATMREDDPEYFARRAGKQEPHCLVVGCSDSRVPTEVLMNVAPGEIFVHRNIANQVFPSDLNLLSVLHSAVEGLDVEHVIVCGHHGCGGVAAAMGDASYGVVDNWLGNIRNVMRWNYHELDRIADAQARVARLVELNVVEQVAQLARTPTVRSAWRRGRRPTLHGVVYSMADGVLHTLVTGVDGAERAQTLLGSPGAAHGIPDGVPDDDAPPPPPASSAPDVRAQPAARGRARAAAGPGR